MIARKAAAGGPLTAYVLHQWDWSESSLIVELLTRERGRLAVAAKGAKRPTSNFRALLLPFNRLVVQLGKAPADDSAELFNLRSADWAGGVPFVGGAALFAGFYANELVLKLLPRLDPHAALFDAYAALMGALQAEAESARQSALRAFELLLLRELGWLPDLRLHTQTQQPLASAQPYGLHAEFGVVADNRHGLTGAAMMQAADALDQQHFGLLQAATESALPAWRLQLRSLLHYHLGTSQLRTRQVLQGVQALIGAAPRPSPSA